MLQSRLYQAYFLYNFVPVTSDDTRAAITGGISAIILLIITYVFDMYPEARRSGNKFQSTQVMLP
jgi:hypothetical protein